MLLRCWNLMHWLLSVGADVEIVTDCNPRIYFQFIGGNWLSECSIFVLILCVFVHAIQCTTTQPMCNILVIKSSVTLIVFQISEHAYVVDAWKSHEHATLRYAQLPERFSRQLGGWVSNSGSVAVQHWYFWSCRSFRPAKKRQRLWTFNCHGEFPAAELWQNARWRGAENSRR